jgi:hypothetical protein
MKTQNKHILAFTLLLFVAPFFASAADCGLDFSGAVQDTSFNGHYDADSTYNNQTTYKKDSTHYIWKYSSTYHEASAVVGVAANYYESTGGAVFAGPWHYYGAGQAEGVTASTTCGGGGSSSLGSPGYDYFASTTNDSLDGSLSFSSDFVFRCVLLFAVGLFSALWIVQVFFK